MIIEGKYPNSFYNNFLFPLAVDSISLYQNIAKILGLFCVVADHLFKRPIRDEQINPFAVHCPPWDPKKIDKKKKQKQKALNFRKKIVSPDKRKHITEVSNFSVTSCLLKALKNE